MTERTLSYETPVKPRIKSLAWFHAAGALVTFTLAFGLPMASNALSILRIGMTPRPPLGLMFVIAAAVILPAFASATSGAAFYGALFFRQRTHPAISRFAPLIAILSGALAFPGFYVGLKLLDRYPRFPSALILLISTFTFLAVTVVSTLLCLRKSPNTTTISS